MQLKNKFGLLKNNNDKINSDNNNFFFLSVYNMLGAISVLY